MPRDLTDWGNWHLQYDIVPSLQARLELVREQIAATLDLCPPGKIKIVSMCAGDGRDVIGAVQLHRRQNDVSAVLLDKHPESVSRGRAEAERAGLERQIRFIQEDASLARSYADMVPADLLILSGFLGHVREESVLGLIESLPMLCRPGGWVIWNRHLMLSNGSEQVPAIRALFRQSEFREVRYETTGPDGFAVSCVRYAGRAKPLETARVLFALGESERSAHPAPIETPLAEEDAASVNGTEAKSAKATEDLFDVEQSIPVRFAQTVALHSSRKAIGSGEWQPTYAELNKVANQLAAVVLSGRGATGDRVALLLRQDAPLIAAMLAILKAGRVVVVLNSTDPPARLKQILRDAEPAAIVCDSANRKLAEEIAEPPHHLISFEEHCRGTECDPEIDVAPSDLAFLIYTSGSTGHPKGVMQTHRNILHNVKRHTRGMELCAEDRIVLLASPSGGQGMALTWCALLNGATLCPFPTAEQGLAGLAERMVEHRITVYVSSVSVLRNFFRTMKPGERVSSVRLVRFASESATVRDFDACKRHFASGCVMLNTFSSSETGNVTQFRLNPASHVAAGRLPIGKPAEGMEILLCDETGRVINGSGIGEIVVKSRFLSPGYWRNEALTAERFSDAPSENGSGIFRSGDLARRTADGTLVFAGRKDNRVKVHGYRVEVSEVEETLLQQPEIESAVVCTREASNGDNRLVAYVVLHRGQDCHAENLRRILRAQLPGYMVPSHLVFLDRLPLTPHGKVDRQALPPPHQPKSAIRRTERPQDIVEKSLASIWQTVLGVPPIGRHDDFFDLGGTSLQAVEVLLQIEEKFGVALPPSTLAEHSTIEKLAPLLANHVVIPSASPLVVLRAAETGRPLFLVHTGQGDVTTYALLARRLPGRPIYGLQSPGLQGESWPLMSIPAMAQFYLRQVIAKDPAGPYLLAGTCMGGIVAFEMAQQLVREGREVGLLALLDVPHPLPGWRHRNWKEKYYGTLRNPVRDAVRILRWSIIRTFGLGRSPRGLTAYRHFVANMNSLANRAYKPKFYPGTITFVTTVDTQYPDEDRRLMMQRYANESRVITLPGNRSGLFTKPVVDELAMKLQTCLEQAEIGNLVKSS